MAELSSKSGHNTVGINHGGVSTTVGEQLAYTVSLESIMIVRSLKNI
jgi:hypothetical protein